MALAKQRRYLDADSHLMELPDFLTAHADAELKKRLPEINLMAVVGVVNHGAKQRYREATPQKP